MKLGVLGDIHANREALDIVLSHLERNGVDELVHVGDIIGYCSDFESVIRMIADNGIPGVIGNHEQMLLGLLDDPRVTREASAAIAWTRHRISDRQTDFLRALPEQIVSEDYLVFHAKPGDSTYRFSSSKRATPVVAEIDRRWPGWTVAFHGHMHSQRGFVASNGETRLAHRGEGQLALEPGLRYLVCPGSVGISRDSRPDAAYLIYDTTGSIEFGRLSYDWQKRDKSNRAAGLHSRLFRRAPTAWQRARGLFSRFLGKPNQTGDKA